MKRMLIDQEDIESKLNHLKNEQIKSVPLEYQKFINEPFVKKKGLVKSHSEIIKFPVYRFSYNYKENCYII